jgi:hypothetical protein
LTTLTTANRHSILAHGLDWTRMGAAPGIAGSLTPEAEGIFLCTDESEAQFFTRINNTGGPVDIWAVTGIDQRQMIDAGSGFSYYPATIPASQINLVAEPPARQQPGNRRTRSVTRSEPPSPGTTI